MKYFLIIIVTLSFTACHKAADVQNIVGRWTATVSGSKETIEFSPAKDSIIKDGGIIWAQYYIDYKKNTLLLRTVGIDTAGNYVKSDWYRREYTMSKDKLQCAILGTDKQTWLRVK